MKQLILWSPDPILGQQTSPSVDSDGTRFSIAYADSPLGSSNRDVRISTVRYLPRNPGPGILMVDANRVLIGTATPDQAEVRLCAHSGGGNQGTARFVIASRNLTENLIHTDIYDAYTPGPLFTHRSTGCAPSSLGLNVWGLPVPGERVYFALQGAPNAAVGMSLIMMGGRGGYTMFGQSCDCQSGGVNPTYQYGTQFTWDVPRVASLVGTEFSAQGMSYAMTSCLGSVAITNIVDFTVR